jgi:hypothetical protein
MRHPHEHSQARNSSRATWPTVRPWTRRRAARTACSASSRHRARRTQPADFRPEDEVTQGNNVAEAAHAAGVAHLVYTSVIGADRPTGMPNVDSWTHERQVVTHQTLGRRRPLPLDLDTI